MKMLLLLFLFSCAFGQNVEMTYPQHIFDSDTCCWRKLASAAKYEQAANLIVTYLRDGHPINKQPLNWHAGQLFAQAQKNTSAILYMRKTTNVFHRWFGGNDGKAWYWYVHGVIAFLERDRTKLQSIIARWNKKMPKDKNYSQLVLIEKNWEKPYFEASK